MKKLTLSLALAALTASPALAGHANPWADEDDTLLMQNHEENLAQSVDTPGEDEMLGEMVQQACGKLDTDLADQRDGGNNGGGKNR
ncbi:hypothetical protein [Actibacterium sp. D379-3]